MNKIKKEDLTEADLIAAREIIHHVISFQTEKTMAPVSKEALLSAIINQGKADDEKISIPQTSPDPNTEWELCYCGIFWSWWLIRYLIAAQWGCELDMTKLGLLYAFCRYYPIILQSKDKKHITSVKPTKIKWHLAGETAEPFKFPIYELHSDGESTVECPGLKEPLYYWHNVKIPSYIGKTKSSDWRAKWIASERNTEIRRILLKEIPRERLIKELNPDVLDSWREYTLMQIQLDGAPTPVNLLEMKCSSTGDSHVLRVPHTMTKAEEAITWCNHGVHPDEFIEQH